MGFDIRTYGYFFALKKLAHPFCHQCGKLPDRKQMALEQRGIQGHERRIFQVPDGKIKLL